MQYDINFLYRNLYKQNVGIFGSNTIMVALSLDRFYLVLRPLGSLAVRGDLPPLLLTYTKQKLSLCRLYDTNYCVCMLLE